MYWVSIGVGSSMGEKKVETGFFLPHPHQNYIIFHGIVYLKSLDVAKKYVQKKPIEEMSYDGTAVGFDEAIQRLRESATLAEYGVQALINPTLDWLIAFLVFLELGLNDVDAPDPCEPEPRGCAGNVSDCGR